MEKSNAWKKFIKSGSIYSYLEYKGVQKEVRTSEHIDGRIGNKGK